MSVRRLLCGAVFCFLLLGAAPPQKRLDGRGNPLPDGAVARFGHSRFVAPNGGPVNSVAWSPDGKLVASGGRGITIWDVETAKVVRATTEKKTRYATALAWSKDGKSLASMDSESKFIVWDAAAMKPRWTESQVPAGKNLGVVAMHFVEDDSRLAIVTSTTLGLRHRDADDEKAKDSAGWRVELWDVNKGTFAKAWTEREDERGRLKDVGPGYRIRHVALSPSGERMAWLASSPSDAKDAASVVLLYDTASGRLIRGMKKLPWTARVDLPDEGETLVLYPDRPEQVEAQTTKQGMVVGIPDGKVRFRFDYRFVPRAYVNPWTAFLQGRVVITRSAVRFHDSLLISDAVGLTRWDWKAGKKQDACDRRISGFALSRDGKRLAVRGGDGGRRFQISDGGLAPLDDDDSFTVTPSIRFLTDGRLELAVNEQDLAEEWGRRLWIRDPLKGTVIERQYAHPYPWGVEGWSADEAGKLLVYRDRQGEGHWVHDLVANKQLCGLKDLGSGYYVEMSLDGSRVLAHKNEDRRLIVRWFDARSGSELGKIEVEKTVKYSKTAYAYLYANWYSRDGSLLGHGTGSGTVTLFDCDSRKTISTIEVPISDRLRIAGNQFLFKAPPQYSHLDAPRNARPHRCTVLDRRGQTIRYFSVPAEWWRTSLSPDGRLQPCLALPKEVIVYETITGRPRYRIPLPKDVGGKILWAHLSPDGKLLATPLADTTVLVWEVDRLRTDRRDLPVPKNAEQAASLWQTLGDDDPAKAEPALTALVAAPERALAAMKDRLAPAKARDEKLFAKPNAVPACLREIRALEVLERIGTAEAKKLVQAIADGHADALLTREAKLVLGRWR